MLEGYERDQVIAFMARRSNLTNAQLDTILISSKEGKLDQKILMRDKGQVSKGSFLRTLKQGRSNIEASVYTFFLLAYLGLVPEAKLDQLVRTQRLLARVRDSPLGSAERTKLLDAMEEFVEGFSGKAKHYSVL